MVVDATIVLPEYNKSFTSMPGLFGGQLGYNDPPVMAHLTVIKDWLQLCPRDDEGQQTDMDQQQQEQPENVHAQHDNNKYHLETPDDGLPVALLVERGGCTFYEKAMVAEQYFDGTVQYLVVYDNEMSPDLVPMSSEHPTNTTLVFVSNPSGEGEFF